MKDTLTINGKLYVHTPEVKEEKRLEYIVERGYVHGLHGGVQTKETRSFKLVEIKENEIVVSKDDVRSEVEKYCNAYECDRIIKKLGFKKDGV